VSDYALISHHGLIGDLQRSALVTKEGTIDPSGRQIGNFPQAFTHLALVHADIDPDAALNAGGGQAFRLAGGLGLPAVPTG
jgi:hypothetical protein